LSTDISTREGLFKVMRQIAAEREAAKPVVAELLQRAEPPWNDDTPPEWQTAGFVDELTKAAAAILEKQPGKTIPHLQLALALSSTLTDRYPSIVVARSELEVLKQLGYTYQYFCDFEQALRAVTAALEKEIPAALQADVAAVTLVQASILARMHRFGEANALLDQTEPVLEVFRDQARLFRCRLYRAQVLLARNDMFAAIGPIQDLIRIAPEMDPGHTEGVLRQNLGVAQLAVGQIAEAEKSFLAARAIYERLGMPLEFDRLDWSLAVITMLKGDPSSALTTMRRLRTAHLERGEHEKSASIALDMVDALLTLNRPVEARGLARQAVEELQDGNFHPNLEKALAYLRDLTPKDDSVQRAVQAVKRHIASRPRTSATEAVLLRLDRRVTRDEDA
jgi:tetratricopeptide (TPR) repeat protein